MTISPLGWDSTRFDLFQPAVSCCVKNSEVAVVLLPIISAEYIQLLLEESGGMILYLRCLDRLTILKGLIVFAGV